MKYYLKRKLLKRVSKKFIRHTKLSYRKKRLQENIPIMNSPYNTSEYLIKNCSSPFFDEEDFEEDFILERNDINDIANGLREEKDFGTALDKMNSTCDESEIISGQINEQEKKIEANFKEMQKK